MTSKSAAADDDDDARAKADAENEVIRSPVSDFVLSFHKLKR